MGGRRPVFPSPVIALTGCLHQSGWPCSLYWSLSSAHVTLPETGHQRISLSAEGTSFCEKMVIVPNMAPMAAGRTTQDPSSQPIGCGLNLCCGLLGLCMRLWGGREYLLGHLSRVSSFDGDHGHSIRAGCPLVPVPHAHCLLPRHLHMCQGDQRNFPGFRTESSTTLGLCQSQTAVLGGPRVCERIAQVCACMCAC